MKFNITPYMLNQLIPLTAKDFAVDFAEKYERFKNTHTVVASGRFSIPLNPIIGGDNPDTRIIARQKTNLQCQVGIDFTPQKGILTLGTAQLFTFESENFETIELSLLIDQPEELFLYLKGYLSSILEETGIRIDLLSEAPRGYSLGFSGTFSGVLAETIWNVRNGNKTDCTIETIQHIKDEIAHMAGNIEQILKSDERDGPISFQTLFAEGTPSTFVLKKGKGNKHRELKKLEGVQYNLERNFDYGIIYSGIPMISKKIHTFVIPTENTLEKWCKSKFGIQLENTSFYKAMTQVLTFENIEFLRKLDIPIAHPESEEVGLFLRSGNILAESFEKLEGSSQFLEHIWKILKKEESLSVSDIAILPIYTTTRGGSYVWYGRRGIARKNLYKAIIEARKRYHELNILFDSTTYLPSYNPEVQIIHDKRTSEDTTVYEDTTGGYILRSPNKEIHTKQYDSENMSYGKLLVDQITRKIYINGERVSSKEILSQQLTIDLLDKYMNSGKSEIHASELPSSSYTQNKSEMMSKIIHPLMRTIQRKLGKNIKLSCAGSTVDFVIRFDEVNVELCSIERV